MGGVARAQEGFGWFGSVPTSACCAWQVQGPAGRRDSPTTASASGTLRPQHVQHMLRARSRDELHAETAQHSHLERRGRSRDHLMGDPVAAHIPNGRRGSSPQLQQLMGGTGEPLQHQGGRGGGGGGGSFHSLSPSHRGALGDTGHVAVRAGRSRMPEYLLGDDGDLSDRETHDWIAGHQQGSSPVDCGGSPGADRTNGVNGGLFSCGKCVDF